MTAKASVDVTSPSIPIRNLWLLLLYAGNRHVAAELLRAGADDNPDRIPELVAELLVGAARERMQQNLSPGYVATRAVGARPRGRIELAATMRRGLEHRGVFAYRFDQHTIDTQRNRYLNETLRLIAYRIGARHAIDGASLTAREAASLARTLTECGVAATPTTGYRAESEVFGQHDRGDARVMQLAQLFRSLRIPSQADGAMRIDELERDETALRKTFERAMYGVLRHALESGWAVKHGGRLAWPVERATIGAATIVPRMEIDIRVDNHTTGARTIIDTKYTSITHRGQFDRERLRSSHIYQVYAYIRSQESVNDVPSLSAAGVLLHPSVGVDVDESVWMHGHRFRFVTVDLASDVRTLRAQVLRAVEHEVLPNRTHS